jgi:hydroxymethylglutaryl-CoA lyase
MDSTRVDLIEVGPREGFQFEGIGQPDKISLDAKLELIEELAQTGLRTIEVASFVSPRAVPQMADAEELSARLPRHDGVSYTAVYLDSRGLDRALEAGRYAIEGRFFLTASDTFLERNLRRTHEQDLDVQRANAEIYAAHDIPVVAGSIMAAFGCNYEGDIPTARVLQLVEELDQLTAEAGGSLDRLLLADTMGWADPRLVQRTVAAVKERWPGVDVALHLHDTRGTGMANVYAALEAGVRAFDTSVGGLGGCPFAGVAAGNVPTEDVVFMCERMGLETGVDLGRLVDAARTAQRVVGHELPSRMLAAGMAGVAAP